MILTLTTYLSKRMTTLVRQLSLLVLYSGTLATSLWLSYLLRFDFQMTPEVTVNLGTVLTGMVGLKLLLLVLSGQFGSLLSYFGVHDVQKILGVTAIVALVALAVWSVGGIIYAPPRAVIVTDMLLSFVGLCTLRMGFRLLREGYFGELKPTDAVQRSVAIVGAGSVGASLVRDLLMRRGMGMRPVAIFDDDRQKWGLSVHGVSVRGSPDQIPEFCNDHKLDKIILAMPHATGKRVQELVSLFAKTRISFDIVPSVEQLVTGKVRVSQIRPVEIEDLLGREAINLEGERIREIVRGQVVVVTGAGGSIGSELCRQIASYGPSRLLLIERCEYLLFMIEQELHECGSGADIVPLVADILDRDRMRSIFERFKPQLIFHAAAHKHVPMMENQPSEALRNNLFGTRFLAELAITHSVDRFVLISSDKAINPTNVMGATKRLAEICLQALQKHAGATRFMAVRFGNVLGSSGSVIPTFKKQIAGGGPVTVTHPDVTRYFMTVHEAVGLVLQTATLGQGGEIFILDMGKPIKIADLARQLIELSGFKPDEDIEIKYVGLRPGEKLFEELRHHSENLKPTTHSRILRLDSVAPDWTSHEPIFRELERTAPSSDAEQLKLAIKKIVPEYSPFLS